MTSDGQGLRLGSGARVGIVAGGGNLPIEIAQYLAARGHNPFVVILEGESDPASPLGRYDHLVQPLEAFGSLVSILKRHGVTHAVLAGEVKRRPHWSALRFNAGLLALLPTVIASLARGDDGLLRAIVRYIERRGIRIVGAHQIVPELLAIPGAMTDLSPTDSDWKDIDAALVAARAIGALDIGQGAVAIGGRVIALEGIEGTDGLLERVRDLRDHGRLSSRRRGVLVKCAKPGQEERADLPSIGPQTVDAAHAAGLAGIGVEAGRSLVLEGPAMVARANALGLFVVGLPTAGRG
jgi:DUF1009 family protein